MSRFSVIDLESLPAMQALETLDSEAVVASRMEKFVEIWDENDPPAAATYDVENLEFDPIKINQECSTYFELLLRDRVNQNTRAVTLSESSGSDIDNIASRYPGGMPRLPIVTTPRGDYEDYPLDYESDDTYRKRIWLSPNTFANRGVKEAYEFWARTAMPTLRDVSAIKVRRTLRENPLIVVTCLANSSTDPKPSAADLLTVREYIADEGRQGLTDEVSVLPPKVKTINYKIKFKLFPSIDPVTSKTNITTALNALIEKQRYLGVDHTKMAIMAACALHGVANIEIVEPATDTFVDENWVVMVNSVTVDYAGRSE